MITRDFESVSPSAALAGCVTALHAHAGSAVARPFRRLPGPFAALVVHAGDAGWWKPGAAPDWRPYPRIALHGLATRWSDALQPAGASCLMALIEPWAVEALFGIPGAATIDRVIDLEAGTMAPPFARAASLRDLAAALEHRGEVRHSEELLAVVAQARREAGAYRVDSAAALTGVGDRSLRRLFHATLGVSPKRWFEIERFSANLRLLHPAPWDGRTLAPSYFDQAHEIREFRRFAGVTPGAYSREKRGGDRRVYAYG